MEVVACPAHRKNIPAVTCSTCEHQDTVVGCRHFKRVVPVEYCLRVCPMQRGPRSHPDARTGIETVLGPLLAPILKQSEALCGAPWVLANWGTARPIFGGASMPAIEDPKTNVVRGCRFPHQVNSQEVSVSVPKGLEV